MESILKALIGMGITPENLVRALGAGFVLLGFLEPEVFFGIKIPWKNSKRIVAACAGVLIFLATIPQLQIWNWRKIPVERSVIQELSKHIEDANDAVLKARRQSAFNACYDSASEGLIPLALAYNSVKGILGKAN